MRTFGVLNIGMGMIVFLYTGLGFFGYIRYGSAIEGSITLSLNEPLILAKSVQILLAIAIFFTHPIQCYVAIDIVWNEYIASNFEKNSHKLLWEYVVRTSLVLLTCKWTSLESFTLMWCDVSPDQVLLIQYSITRAVYRWQHIKILFCRKHVSLRVHVNVLDGYTHILWFPL